MGDTLVGTAQAEDPLGKVFFFTKLAAQKGSPFADIAGKEVTSQFLSTMYFKQIKLL
ncbi:hypothetical protein [Paraliobacillus sediminis]|uniref:hypothetical protein n=1 Tax=Paraliobacillus sediminis TaxID=1885916 RepID=UPI0013C349A2|nr:hypothetical protein [Paraliobacillus sediminis]